MSPPAAGMALALHVTVALALWWVSPLKFIDVESQQPIEVTMEAPVPPPTPTPPEPPQATQPAAPPPAPSPAAPASRPPPPSGSAQGPLGLPPRPTPEPPKPQPPAAVEPQQALAPPKIDVQPAPEPGPPPVDKVLPRVEAPPAPLTMQDFVKIAPPPPHEVVKPLPQQVAPAPPQHVLKPSPLSTPQQQASRDSGSSPNTFVNPADTYVHTQAADNYLSQVARKISQYRYYQHTPVVRTVEGVVVTRLVIARDGRLLDVSVVRSSGFQTLDTGLLDTIRKASPFPPLPGDVKGDKASFTLNIPYRLNPE